jgi:hypothetical protein
MSLLHLSAQQRMQLGVFMNLAEDFIHESSKAVRRRKSRKECQNPWLARRWHPLTACSISCIGDGEHASPLVAHWSIIF